MTVFKKLKNGLMKVCTRTVHDAMSSQFLHATEVSSFCKHRMCNDFDNINIAAVFQESFCNN
jgi:hypothetical protein